MRPGHRAHARAATGGCKRQFVDRTVWSKHDAVRSSRAALRRRQQEQDKGAECDHQRTRKTVICHDLVFPAQGGFMYPGVSTG